MKWTHFVPSAGGGPRVGWLGVVFVGLAVIVVGCSKGRGLDDAWMAKLAAADGAWQPKEPGFETGLRAAMAPLIDERPAHPDVLWRHARLEVAEGLASSDPLVARDHFGKGRALAARCVDLDAAFQRRRTTIGWESALVQAYPSEQRCVDQLAWAWARWWIAADPEAMHLDETAVRALTARAKGERDEWSRALYMAGRIDPSPDAAARLDAVVAEAPWDLARVADAAILASDDAARFDAYLRSAEERARAKSPRDQAALERLRAHAERER